MTETSLERTSQTDIGSVETATAESTRPELGQGHTKVTRVPEPEAEHWDNPPTKRTWSSEIVKNLVSLLILGGGAGIMFGLYGLKEPPKEQVSQELVPMVGVVNATPYSGQLDKLISGTVVPYREIRVAAEVSGNIVKKYDAFEAGNFVKQGTRLLEIDPVDYQLQLEAGLAEVKQSEKALKETGEEIAGAKRKIQLAENEFQLAQDEYQRNLRISNALSSSELDQSKRNLLGAETALTTQKNALDLLNARAERLKASLSLVEAQLDRAKLNLSKTTIFAPDDGVVVREMVQEGDYVRAGDPVVTFEDTSRAEVICNLTPTDLAWIRDNSPASVEFRDEKDSKESFSVYYIPKTKVSVFEIDEPEIVWDGMLERFDGIGRDESTRTIPCRIMIRNPVIDTKFGPRALVRGMYVKCKIQVQTSADDAKRKFLSFPSVALRSGNTVWVVRDHKLKRLPVQVVDYGEQLVGQELKNIVVIAEADGSVRAGDSVVTTPLSQPSNGGEVILEEEFKNQVSSEIDVDAKSNLE